MALFGGLELGLGGHLIPYVLATIALTFMVNFFITIVRLFLKKADSEEKLKDFPGPEAHWLFGNINELAVDSLGAMRKWCDSFGQVCRVRLGPFAYHLRAMHPDPIRAIAATKEPKEKTAILYLGKWIGDGLLLSKGQKWQRHRRLLTPAFHFDILKPYVDLFSDGTNVLMNNWRRECNNEEKSIEVFQHTSLLMMDGMMKCIFGENINALEAEGCDHPYVKAVTSLGEQVIARMRVFRYQWDFIWNLSWPAFKFRRTCRIVHDFSEAVIQARKLEKAAGIRHNEKYLDFLDIILDARDEDGNGLSDAAIRDEVDTFMFEGHDTTASGMAWCLYNMAGHPEYQAKCREEVNDILGDRDDVTWADVQRMQYLTMCVKESLRRNPPVPYVSRDLTKPLQLPDGTIVPEDTTIGTSIYACHRNPKVWKDPEVYDPERFSPENRSKMAPYAYVPFSAGPRNCIGQNFALYEMKTGLAILLKNFELSLDESKSVKEHQSLTLKSENGLWLKVKPIVKVSA